MKQRHIYLHPPEIGIKALCGHIKQGNDIGTENDDICVVCKDLATKNLDVRELVNGEWLPASP